MGSDKFLKSFHNVSSYELDSFGHVNNAIFLNYLEKARCDYLVLKGLSFNDFFLWKKYPIVVKSTLEYKYPATAHDKLLIKGWISAYTTTSFTMKYEIINQDNNKLILKAETIHAFINEINKPTRIPEEFFVKFLK